MTTTTAPARTRARALGSRFAHELAPVDPAGTADYAATLRARHTDPVVRAFLDGVIGAVRDVFPDGAAAA